MNIKSYNFVGVTISKNESEFFDHSFLTIKNITNEFNGNISCSMLKKTRALSKEQSFTINIVGKYFFFFFCM